MSSEKENYDQRIKKKQVAAEETPSELKFEWDKSDVP